MRPASTYRRQSAIALVFAAWCAVYGLPTEFARNLTEQTAGLIGHPVSKPALHAKVLLHRLSAAEQAANFNPCLGPSPASPVNFCASAVLPGSQIRRPDALGRTPALFQRPPPVSFLS